MLKARPGFGINSMRDVVIIGGGPAGLTAALYASRQKLDTVLITIDIGGQLSLTPSIENFPAVPPISGYELANSILEQVNEFGCEVIYDEAEEVSEIDGGFKVRTRGGEEYEAKTVILAVGKKPRKLNVPGEEEYTGKGVSYCTVCDAPLYRNKKTAVVGVGEAFHEAVSILRKYENEVIVISPGRVSGELAEKLRGLGAEIMERARVSEIRGEMVVKSIVVREIDSDSEREINVDGVFIEMGYTADTNWLKDFVDLNENGEIIVDKLCRTSSEGVFAAGDVTDMPYKQAVIAAAQGAIAALSADNYIRKLEGKPEIKSDWQKMLE